MSTIDIGKTDTGELIATTIAPKEQVKPLFKGKKTWFGRKRDPMVVVSALIILLVLFAAIFADLISPYRPEFQERGRGVAWQDPSAAHWIGTDGLGRDLLSRIIHGARVAVVMAVGVAVLQLTVGISLGVISGFFGGWVDFIIMRIADLLYAFPGLLLIILVVSVVDSKVPRVFTAFIVISLITWPDVCRLTRAQVLSIKEREYVYASRIMGAPSLYIMIRHLFPNFIRPIAALIPLGMGLVVLTEASLSFLGMGVQPPGASWGNIINDVAIRFKVSPWMVLTPSMCLVVTIMSLNYLSDWLLDE
jgi:ABC-type dipeptide/oligopeptide/nickel transport system permease subunit